MSLLAAHQRKINCAVAQMGFGRDPLPEAVRKNDIIQDKGK